MSTKEKDRAVLKVDCAHASLQFSDTPAQMKHDVTKLFNRAQEKEWWWITGTEAGPGSGPLANYLEEAAEDSGYRFWTPGRADAWIAVSRERISRGTWDTDYQHVIDGEARRWAAKGVVAARWRNDDLGEMHVLAAHYLTKGRPDARDPAYRVNLGRNRELARAIGDYAEEHGKGSALCFYGGDQNIVDRDADTFLGEPLTSTWDELGKWQNTGRGNIDVIASYDRDGRVEAAYARALGDKKFFLHSDHFLVEAGFRVKELPDRKK